MKANKSLDTLKFFVMVISSFFFLVAGFLGAGVLGAGGVVDAEGGGVDVAEGEAGCVGAEGVAERGCVGDATDGTDPMVSSDNGAVPRCCSEPVFDCEGAEII